MKIPLTVTRNKKEYIFVQKYPNFLLYENLKTKVKECFDFHELGILKETVRPPKTDLNLKRIKI